MYKLGTIRQFNTKNFSVVVDAIEEDQPDFSFDETGETALNVHTGKWICFCARVRVFCMGEELASEYLGNCIYSNIEEFQDHRECGRQNRERKADGDNARCGSYFIDMIHSAITEARASLSKMQAVKLRLAA